MSAESEVLKQSHPRSRASVRGTEQRTTLLSHQFLKVNQNVELKNAPVSITKPKSNVHA